MREVHTKEINWKSTKHESFQRKFSKLHFVLVSKFSLEIADFGKITFPRLTKLALNATRISRIHVYVLIHWSTIYYSSIEEPKKTFLLIGDRSFFQFLKLAKWSKYKNYIIIKWDLYNIFQYSFLNYWYYNDMVKSVTAHFQSTTIKKVLNFLKKESLVSKFEST